MAAVAERDPSRSFRPYGGVRKGAFSEQSIIRARANWARYEYGRNRGHRVYMEQAKRCERFYLGGGLQWEPDDWSALDSVNIKPIEQNEIMPKINAALGYQLSNRMDITFSPREDTDDDKANTVTKVVKQITDSELLHWKETQLCADGFIQQRGYYDLRMCFDTNVFGDIDLGTLDPLDVIPDPDAKSYDPDDWADVIVTRWYTLDEIEQYYGKEAADAVASYNCAERDFGEYTEEERRNRFGTEYLGDSVTMWDSNLEGIDSRRIRVIDRQYFVRERCKIAVWPTGEIEIAEDADEDQLAEWASTGAMFTKRMMKRVKWLVTTSDVTLHDDYSPYPFFTVIPYFPIFRRGITRGLVDNAISPQELLNKALTSFLHIVNSSANGGWIIEDNSIVNFDELQLEENAAKTGLIFKVKPEAKFAPQKIAPNAVPAGIDKIIDRCYGAISDVMGVNESLEGSDSNEDMSGIAIQSRQFAAQQKLAVPLDNLTMTRHMLGKRLLWIVQHFYTTPRLFRITNDDGAGQRKTSDLPINHATSDGDILNDMTIGKYDLVISSQPMHITFDNSQFEQCIKMREMNINIPARWVLKYSNLQEKDQIAKEMEAAGTAPPDPLTQSKIELQNAQAAKAAADAENVQADTVETKVTAIYAATQAAAQAATLPSVAAVADSILVSAGFQSEGGGDITGPVPQGVPPEAAGPIPPIDSGLPDSGLPAAGAPDLGLPKNTHPTEPALPPSPNVGLDAGIEKPGVQPPP